MRRRGVTALDDGGRAPQCGAPVHGHAAVAFEWPFCGLLTSACAKCGSGVPGGVAEDPLDCLPMGVSGAGCDTGHRVGVDVVDAARLTPCAAGRAVHVV